MQACNETDGSWHRNKTPQMGPKVRKALGKVSFQMLLSGVVFTGSLDCLAAVLCGATSDRNAERNCCVLLSVVGYGKALEYLV